MLKKLKMGGGKLKFFNIFVIQLILIFQAKNQTNELLTDTASAIFSYRFFC